MIGIYCWTNRITNEKYVGQSIDIMKRKAQHIYNSKTENTALYQSMRKYGIENFVFSILEEYLEDELDEKEQFWIKSLDSYAHGYNMTQGGQDHCSIGENNPKTNLTNNDVLTIRNRIHLKNEDIHLVYKEYANRISYDSFWQLAHGVTWTNVDCSMIKSLINNQGDKNPRAKLKTDDVIQIRYRKYVNQERTIDIYQDYKNRISFSAFEKIVLGSTWKHIPIPKK